MQLAGRIRPVYRPDMQDWLLMQKFLDEMPFFISVPIVAFIVAFCRPTADGQSIVGWRRFHQSLMSSFVACGAVYATDAMGISSKWAMVFGIFVGIMGWEYIRATIQEVITRLINTRLK